ncbi:integrin alpha-M isoform X2 [Bos javanicus]|uniref:integrin alpha-M isoform X2 n=1 Tax=Bos javanicus TaxID=9906 RepID=UPI002AA729D3|nr:integrin alpha-M isoform X2 [Bos javanicus]
MNHRILLLTALALCHGFNLDTEKAVIFQNNARGFGQSVVQIQGSRLVVGAPQEVKAANQTGGLYHCDYSTGRCEAIPLQVPPEAVNMSLGLSLAFAANPFRLLACGPTVHQICKENTYANGLCFSFGSNLLQQPRRIPRTLRGCPEQDSDIAFLIDGSGSIDPVDFERMKRFVSTVMSQFQKSKTLFSLMQYSDDFQTHFTFNDFKRNPVPEFLVGPIRQLFGRTHTATGIRKVVRELFHSSSGARNHAIKIMIVITDGEKYLDPLEYSDVIPEADRKKIIRYVIGVGDAFRSRKSRQELDTIASKPPADHVFQVNNFEALKTIQNQLQEKIFAIEGTQTGSTSSFEHEMSQEGFSAAFTSDGPLLGAVGSFDWAGGAFLHTSNDKITFINTTRIDSDMNDAYLGYAAEVTLRNRVQHLFLGAPRYQHIGLVVIFRQNAGVWQKNAEIKGSQIGSYFGASLCSVDVNRDGSSDLVLIGAPHFYEQMRGGQVSMCPFPRGRITGSQISPKLQYFGQSLSGGQDLTMDGLVDLAVGAQGHVLLLRSQPVLKVEATMEFTPKEVKRNVYECRDPVVKGQIAGQVKVCLQVRKSTWDRLGEGDTQSTITYDLALDPGRPHSVAIFDETQNSTRRRVETLRLSQKCETLKLRLLDCVEDSVTPIALRLNFSLVGEPAHNYGGLRPVLAVDALRLFTASLPFEKNCGNDTVCQDDLSITFSFMDLDTLVVGGPRDLNVTVTVRNEGEDSYRTQVTFFYPSGLSYRRVSSSQNQRSQRFWRLTCESDVSTEGSGILKRTSCGINHPIFLDNSEITFNVTFDVNPDTYFGNKLLLKANVTSENNMPGNNKTQFQLELPVKYAVYMVVTSLEASTKYLNFTASEKTIHAMEHQYQFNNLGRKKLPISVVFWIPIRLNKVPVWSQPQVTFSQDVSSGCNTTEVAPRHSDFLAELKKSPVLNCSVAVCQRIQCAIPSFGIQEEFKVTLKSNFSFDWYIKTSHNHLQVVSKAEILFDESKFTLLPGQDAFVMAQTGTKVESYEVHNPIPLIVGSSVGGLVLLALISAGLYKLGFFKRQYKDMMTEPGPEVDTPQ